MKRLKIALAGTKFVADLHMLTFSKLNQEKFEIIGVCSGSADNAASFAKKHSLTKWYADFEEMLQDPEVDVVDICTPNNLHRDMVVAAAHAGKHIICEKPITGAFGEGHDVEKVGFEVPKQALYQEALDNLNKCKTAVTKAGVFFGYAENFIYAPALTKAKRLLSQSNGFIHDIRAEESHSGSHADYAGQWRLSGGGSLLRMGAHPVGAALHLKHWEGEYKHGKAIRPKSIMCEVAHMTQKANFQNKGKKWIKDRTIDVEDWSAALITFEDDSKASIIASDCSLGGVRNQIQIYSSNAVLNININPNDALSAYSPQHEVFGEEYLTEKVETKAGWQFASPDEEWFRGYDAEFNDFIDCIRERREPLSGMLLAEDTLKVIYAGYLSAEQGKRITIE